jgi:hypothetical protein
MAVVVMGAASARQVTLGRVVLFSISVLVSTVGGMVGKSVKTIKFD